MKWSHNEPLFWGLFGAGGVISAFVAPAMILGIGLLGPLGESRGILSYENVRAMADHFFVAFAFWVVVSLTLWHCAHRIFHGLHDLGYHPGLGARLATYGVAGMATLIGLFVVF